MASHAIFRHQRLEDVTGSTRILYLQPSRSFDSPLYCELGITRVPSHLEWFEGDVQDPPPVEYDALSYVWGSPTGDRELICQGKTLFITENCEAALRRLRLKNETRTLWVDSICIDQTTSTESTAERNEQVEIMAQIYSYAKRVIVWLGEGSPELHRALTIARFYPKESPGSLWHRCIISGLVRWGMCKYGSADECVFGSFLDNPWNWRAWTMQELGRAQQRALVQTGAMTIPWHTVYKAILTHRSWHDAGSVENQRRSMGVFARGTLWEKFVYRGSHLEAEGVLELATHMRSSDPRDKIFSLYSYLKIMWPGIDRPDYNLSVEEVFANATAQFLDYGHLHKALYRAQVPDSEGRMPGLPSWVIDWTTPSELVGAWHNADAFRATGDSGSDFEFLRRSTMEIVLKGQIFSRIRKTRRKMPYVDRCTLDQQPPAHDYEQMELQRLHRVRLILSKELAVVHAYQDWLTAVLALRRYGSRRDRLQAACGAFFLPKESSEAGQELRGASSLTFAETILRPLGEPDSEIDELNAKARDDIFLLTHSSLVDKVDGLRPLVDDPSLYLVGMRYDQSNKTEEKTSLNRFIGEVEQRLANHSLFVTSTGHFGFAFHKVEPKDVVVLVPGLGIPLILRPTVREYELHYRLVSPAYVYGIMHGEAWNISPRPRRSTGVIVLTEDEKREIWQHYDELDDLVIF